MKAERYEELIQAIVDYYEEEEDMKNVDIKEPLFKQP